MFLYGMIMSEKAWKEGVEIDKLQADKGLELDGDLGIGVRDMAKKSRRGSTAI